MPRGRRSATTRSIVATTNPRTPATTAEPTTASAATPGGMPVVAVGVQLGVEVEQRSVERSDNAADEEDGNEEARRGSV